KTAAILFGFVLAVMLVEIGGRVVSPTRLGRFLGREVDPQKSALPPRYDRGMGWVARAGFLRDRNVWKTQVTITSSGLRTNGGSGVSPPGSPILAVGDSFTFGDGVSDGDTWPAWLESKSGIRCSTPVCSATAWTRRSCARADCFG